MKDFITFAIIMLFTVLPILGCNEVSTGTFSIETEPVEVESDALSSVLAATESPRNSSTPKPLDEKIYDEYCRFIEREFTRDYRVDLSEITYSTASPFASEIEGIRSLLLSLPERIKSEAEAVFDHVADRASKHSSIQNKPMSTDFECEPPSWRLIAATTWAYGVEETENMLQSSARVSVTVTGGVANLSLSFPTYDELIDSTEPSKHFSSDFVYNYFTTVYNDEFEMVDYVSPALPKDYVYTIGLPLKNMLYYDSWYGGRQSNSRVHLGQDIRSRKGSEIFSCTDGMVAAIGYDDIAGNYVVVIDNYGYEYHYYHMVTLTDFLSVGDTVLKGDIIGHVGATGNSDTNHLHLAIVAPDHIYLNPYELMCIVGCMTSD